MRQCSKCNTQKTLDEFPKKGGWCNSCSKQYQSEYNRKNREKRNETQRKWREENPEKVLEATKKHQKHRKDRRKSNKKNLVSLLGGCCKVCGYSKCLEALEFHHVDPTKKDGQVSLMISTSELTSETIAEVNKCYLLCANCHREFHAGLIVL